MRYRYYVSQAAHRGDGQGLRIPARELEALALARLREELADPFALADKAAIIMQPHDILRLHREAITPDKHAIIGLVEQVRIAATSIDVVCSGSAIARVLELRATDPLAKVTLTVKRD
jgi:hypothetical protein